MSNKQPDQATIDAAFRELINAKQHLLEDSPDTVRRMLFAPCGPDGKEMGCLCNNCRRIPANAKDWCAVFNTIASITQQQATQIPSCSKVDEAIADYRVEHGDSKTLGLLGLLVERGAQRHALFVVSCILLAHAELMAGTSEHGYLQQDATHHFEEIIKRVGEQVTRASMARKVAEAAINKMKQSQPH